MRERHVERRLDARRPRAQHQDAIRQVDGLFHVVRDQHDGVAFLREDAQQFVLHAQAHQRVERRERLVHVEDLGLHHQRARDLGALQHAARQLVRIVVLEALEADELGVFSRQRLAVRHLVRQAEQQVLPHGEPRKHRALLRDQDALASSGSLRGHAVDAARRPSPARGSPR